MEQVKMTIEQKVEALLIIAIADVLKNDLSVSALEEVRSLLGAIVQPPSESPAQEQGEGDEVD